jgi:uncharacterized protein YuzE
MEAMRITYDPEANALSIELHPAAAAHGCDIDEDVSVDFDAEGQVIGLEVLHAQARVRSPHADIVLEPITPQDLYSHVEEKLHRWFQQGKRMVILLHSSERRVTVYHAHRPVQFFPMDLVRQASIPVAGPKDA